MLEPLPPQQQQTSSSADADSLVAEQGALSSHAAAAKSDDDAAAGSADRHVDAEMAEAAGSSAGPPFKAPKLQQGAAEAASSSKAAASVLDRLDAGAGCFLSQLEPADAAYARCSVARVDVEVRVI